MKPRINTMRICVRKRRCWIGYIAIYCKENQRNETKRKQFLQTIKNKQGKSLVEKEEVIERWAEYAEEVYKDENRSEAYMGELGEGRCSITSEEIAHVIKELPKGKACGIDNIPAELI